MQCQSPYVFINKDIYTRISICTFIIKNIYMYHLNISYTENIFFLQNVHGFTHKNSLQTLTHTQFKK